MLYFVISKLYFWINNSFIKISLKLDTKFCKLKAISEIRYLPNAVYYYYFPLERSIKWHFVVYFMLECMLSHFSHVQHFESQWTIARPPRLLCPWGSSGNTRACCHALLQGVFPTQVSYPCLLRLLHCRWILYVLAMWKPLLYAYSIINALKSESGKWECNIWSPYSGMLTTLCVH